jgi:hypothetical protein
LRGYPTVTGIGPAGIVTMHARPTQQGYLGQAKVTTVRLGHGGNASALFEGVLTTYEPSPGCAPYQQIAISPPNTSAQVLRPMPKNYWFCSAEVHPVVAGVWGGANVHDDS